MRHYLIVESHAFLILKVNRNNTFVSLCTYAELILRGSGASCSVTVPSAALAGLGKANEINLWHTHHPHHPCQFSEWSSLSLCPLFRAFVLPLHHAEPPV